MIKKKEEILKVKSFLSAYLVKIRKIFYLEKIKHFNQI